MDVSSLHDLIMDQVLTHQHDDVCSWHRRLQWPGCWVSRSHGCQLDHWHKPPPLWDLHDALVAVLHRRHSAPEGTCITANLDSTSQSGSCSVNEHSMQKKSPRFAMCSAQKVTILNKSHSCMCRCASLICKDLHMPLIAVFGHLSRQTCIQACFRAECCLGQWTLLLLLDKGCLHCAELHTQGYPCSRIDHKERASGYSSLRTWYSLLYQHNVLLNIVDNHMQ